jgi:hypothetical protein
MEWDNVVLSEDFVISGYDVTGNVKSGDEPVQGVNFLLFSKEIKHANCAGSTTLPNIPEQLNKGIFLHLFFIIIQSKDHHYVQLHRIKGVILPFITYHAEIILLFHFILEKILHLK